MGIPDEIIHKLGEPFFTTKQSGTGLGIMITKQILERHQAFLEIEAKEQVGSTFRIIFPLSNK
ncbi:ATP-binding protein [Virgibacillus salarius]|uniref:ATP-binding protein n=1 Tax=Virgibacillus salarius TaxID=447199 RepID=UPI0031EFDA71